MKAGLITVSVNGRRNLCIGNGEQKGGKGKWGGGGGVQGVMLAWLGSVRQCKRVQNTARCSASECSTAEIY